MDRGAWWGMVFNPTCVHAKLLQSCQTLCNPMVACHALLSMGFSRQEYWSGLPFLSLGDLPNPGIKPLSPAMADVLFTTAPPGKPCRSYLTGEMSILPPRLSDIDFSSNSLWNLEQVT